MGDWRTLHLFDTTIFTKEVVPSLKDLETFLPVFLNDKRHFNWLKGFTKSTEEIIQDTLLLVSELNEDLSCHTELIKLSKIANRKYDNYYLHRETFIRQRQTSIEFFEYIMIETIFSRVADFNPHFILGKRIFEGIVETKGNSIAQELASKITSQNESSILDVIDGGIINWLSEEEVKLLYFDRKNIVANNKDGLDYISEFKEFLRYAYENDLGIISLRNPRECELCQLQKVANRFQSVIRDGNYKYIIVREF